MQRAHAILISATLSVFMISTAHAGSGSPGRKGTIAAYAPGPSKVLESKKCKRKKYTWDYVACGKTVRARVKARLCARHGKGTHRYFYQVGNGRKVKSSVYCKSGSSAADNTGSSNVGTGNPGHKGNVAAYFPNRSRVFASRRCHKKGYAWNYTTCGKLLRSEVKRRLCSRLGKGTHKYYYQVSDNKKIKSSVYCKR